jgi:hypothetical protein
VTSYVSKRTRKKVIEMAVTTMQAASRSVDWAVIAVTTQSPVRQRWAVGALVALLAVNWRSAKRHCDACRRDLALAA